MEQIEHKLLIVQWVNALLGGLVEPLKVALGHPTHAGADVIPDYVVMSFLVMFGLTALGLIVRSRLSVENPGKFQIILEDLVSAVAGLLDEWIGPKGRQFLPLIGALGAFILVANYIGLVPGFMAPTSNINVTVGCALTSWVYYHLQGVKAQGLIGYLKHFLGPPGVPVLMLPLMLLIEVISHLARVLSLSLRLFGNIFGEELVIAILAFLVPFLVPLPMMALGLITGGLQAFIFVLLSVIYLQGAVVSEHHDEAHGHHEPSSGAQPAPVAASA